MHIQLEENSDAYTVRRRWYVAIKGWGGKKKY